MTFDDLQFRERPINHFGVQAKVFFPNGYGASIIKGPGTYGGRDGLYELAVLKGTEGACGLCYDTLITSDVEGWLNEDAVTALLLQIEAL